MPKLILGTLMVIALSLSNSLASLADSSKEEFEAQKRWLEYEREYQNILRKRESLKERNGNVLRSSCGSNENIGRKCSGKKGSIGKKCKRAISNAEWAPHIDFTRVFKDTSIGLSRLILPHTCLSVTI
jgi:hypothetical protein